eukprot:4320944-Alexandrium_andersonii.AAC.1
MSASLVGSEMCIRDSPCALWRQMLRPSESTARQGRSRARAGEGGWARPCLLYTSDAADDM